jgi:hypothetical protein
MVSQEIKSKIDSFILECEKWKYDSKLPEIIPINATMGNVIRYLTSINFMESTHIYFTSLCKVDPKSLIEHLQQVYKDDFSYYYCKEIDENEINTIVFNLRRDNPNFDSDLCEEIEDNNGNYDTPESINIEVHLEYYTGLVYLNLCDQY